MARSAKYVINIQRSQHPRAFSKDESLWTDDLATLGRLLDSHDRQLKVYLEKTKSAPRGQVERLRNERPLLSIAIFGPSGSGKSSLLKTLVRNINARDENSWCRADLVSLPVMEPTIWSVKEHFLYAFIAGALEADRRRLDEYHDADDAYPQGLSPVQVKFQKVNDYLRVIDEPEANSDFDPLGNSLQRLERHTSGIRLRDAIEKFITTLVQELKDKKAILVLPVDDIDMAPHHLVDALRSYQNFLLHPQLVPIFTFTDRLPEELLRVYFERVLTVENGDCSQQTSSLEREKRRLTVPEQLAVQFLSRCFPVRNRLRLGPAPGRVQRALVEMPVRLSEPKEKGANEDSHGERQTESIREDGTPVKFLLTTASFLLFGHHDRGASHPVKAILRPSTLRRQIQVVDAMVELDVQAFLRQQFIDMTGGPATKAEADRRVRTGEGTLRPLRCARLEEGEIEGYKKLGEALEKKDVSWPQIFNAGTWSLLNVHRDVLRELDLHLEDLYSWSPKELRTVLLGTILRREASLRRAIFDRWYNRTDFRRAQVLSLLAANAHRPWMRTEEPYGDEIGPLRHRQRVEIDEDDECLPERYSISAGKGLLWFLNVVVGFYLPQVLARNWSEATDGKEDAKDRLTGNGWDLQLGATNAIRVSDYKKTVFSFGMMFLQRDEYNTHLLMLEAKRKAGPVDTRKPNTDCDEDKAREEESPVPETGAKTESSSSQPLPPVGKLSPPLLLRIWTCCGYSRGRFWAAVSLWRGLTLIGQLIEAGIRHKSRSRLRDGVRRPFDDNVTFDAPPQSGDEAKVPRNQRSLEDDCGDLIRDHLVSGMIPGPFLARDSSDEALKKSFPKWDPEAAESDIADLAKECVQWLEFCIWEARVHLTPAKGLRISWRECFLRRLHGEYVVGRLWPALNSEYLQHQGGRTRSQGEDAPEEPWTAATALEAWSLELLEYWRGCRPIVEALLSCPVFVVPTEVHDVTTLLAMYDSGTKDPLEGLDVADLEKRARTYRIEKALWPTRFRTRARGVREDDTFEIKRRLIDDPCTSKPRDS